MRFITVLGTTTLLASLSMSAQVPGLPGPADRAHYFPNVPGCPIAMRAKQGVGGHLSEAQKGQRTEMFAAHLHLGLDDGHSKSAPQMLKATVIVHGLNGRQRVLPLTDAADGSADIIRTFTVNLAPQEEAGMSGELLLPGFTAARLIELKSVTYSDGSTWKFSDQSTCSTAPDMLMPVASR
jgi:hypothetical protein